MAETITGRGQLKIGGRAMDISFTVPAGVCPPQDVLEDIQTFADQVAARAADGVEAAGWNISCRKGCGACCRQMVPVSPVEARHLAALVEAMPEDRAAEVRAKFAAARAAMAAAGLAAEGHPDTGRPAYRAYGLAYFRAGIPCPFLTDESCSIHAERPLVCREYLVTTPPEACAELGTGTVRKVAVPVRVWNVFGRSTRPDGRLEWMPLIDALEYADGNPDPPPVRTGPQHIDAFLKALAGAAEPEAG